MPLLVDVRQLGVINEPIGDGAENVAAPSGTLAGVETTIGIKSLAFVDPQDLPDEIGPHEVCAATIDLTELPYGSFVLLFSDDTAAAVAELVAGQPADGPLRSLQESAPQKMYNICTSGFVYGFANTLDTTIDMGTPTLEHTDCGDLRRTRLSRIRDESIAIVPDSTVCVPERNRNVELYVYLIVTPGAFVNLVDCIDLDAFGEDAADEVPSCAAWAVPPVYCFRFPKGRKHSYTASDITAVFR
jgi:chemotaxis protein CheC